MFVWYTMVTIFVFKFIFQCLQLLRVPKTVAVAAAWTSNGKNPSWIWNNKRVSGVCLGERKNAMRGKKNHIGNSPNLNGNKIYYAWTAWITFSGGEQFNQEMNNLNFDNQFHFDQTEWIATWREPTQSIQYKSIDEAFSILRIELL